MANCSSCSAPLPAHTTICEYCHSRNDVDLKGLHEFTVAKPDSNRICPTCNIPLQTINLAGDGKYYIERCDRCMGLFFDPGELEALLEKSVTNVFQIDHKSINQLIQDRAEEKRTVQYVKCPVCSNMMNRVNFGKRSGVIIDRCKDHGIWLDGGELKQIMEWRKAGGKLLHDQLTEEEKNKPKKTSTGGTIFHDSSYNNDISLGGFDPDRALDLGDDIVAGITKLIGKLFD